MLVNPLIVDLSLLPRRSRCLPRASQRGASYIRYSHRWPFDICCIQGAAQGCAEASRDICAVTDAAAHVPAEAPTHSQGHQAHLPLQLGHRPALVPLMGAQDFDRVATSRGV